MKTHSFVISSLLVIAGLALGVTRGHAFFSKPLLIQSFESKTVTDGPVFNEITWFEMPDKDVWMMNQSHFGVNPPDEKKDRIVIVIDKTKRPKTAYFMQLKPGALVWSEDLYAQKTTNRVSCFVCHANGLRAIRPDFSSIKLGIFEMAKLNYLNYKINSYGFVSQDQRHFEEDKFLNVPFRIQDSFSNEVLKLKSCISCHDGKKRGQLTRQNILTIEFLVKNRLMPPPPEKLSALEAKKVQNFIRGL